MKNIRHISIAAGFLLLILSSCNNFEQVVNVDIPEHKPAISLSAEFGSLDTALFLSVGRSASILASYENLELDAAPEIKLFRNGELLTEDFDCQYSSCVHELNQPLGSAEDTYRIEVSAPGWETVSSTQKMPPLPVIKDAQFTHEGTLDPDGYPADEWAVLIQDPPDEENYYAISTLSVRREFDGTDTLLYTSNYPPSSLDPATSVVYGASSAALILSDATFNGSEYWLRMYSYSQDTSNLEFLALEISSLTKDAYLFYKTFTAYQENEFNPFAEPVVVHQNVENGHGIFILKNTLIKEVEY